jgi:hypothetical protein
VTGEWRRGRTCVEGEGGGGEKNTVSYGGPHGETMAARGIAARRWSARCDGAAGAGRGRVQAASLQLTREISGGVVSSPRGWRRGMR